MQQPNSAVPGREEPDSTDVIQRRFREFAAAHPEVPTYASLATRMADDERAVSILRHAAPGQARPVLLLSALHLLSMKHPDLPAARWFANHPADRPIEDAWPEISAALDEHRDELIETVSSRTTQTNEVNRATYVRAMVAAACADLPDTPITLVELGASAGFLLGIDHYSVSVGDQQAGPVDAIVRCTADNHGAPIQLDLPPIMARIGLDANPIGPEDVADLEWLRACLWPEVPGRIDRFDAAVAHLRTDPPTLIAGDMVDDLARAIDQWRGSQTHLVVFSSWALTYVPRERRAAIADALASLPGVVSWVTAEPPGCMPGLPTSTASGDDQLTGTEVGLLRWRDGVELDPQLLGRVHPHGNWVELTGPAA